MRKNKDTCTVIEDKSSYVHQRDKVGFALDISLKFNLTEKQKEFLALVEDKKVKILLCKGPSGTSKSYLSIYAGLMALKNKKVGELLYLRNPVESSSHELGFLPGDQSSKIAPYLSVLMEKLHELLPSPQIKELEKYERIKGNSIGFLRGASLNATFVCADEVQNFSVKDFLLVMTRMGKFSKCILTGDTRQSDVRDSGFEKVFNLFDNDKAKNNGIYTFKFTKEDIVREPMIGFIIDQFEILGY